MSTQATGTILYRDRTAPFVAGAVLYSPGMRMPPHRHDFTGVSVVLAGSLRETAHGRDEIAHAGAVVSKPADTLHADEIGPRGALLLAIECKAGHELVPHDLHDSWTWLRTPEVTAAALNVGLALTNSEKQTTVCDAVLDLWSAISGNVVRSIGSPPQWLNVVREQIMDDPHDVSVTRLAEQSAVHPVYLARAFRRWYGCSITEFIRCVSQHETLDRLMWSDQSMTRIAYDGGFSDQSHMVRKVRALTGTTPTRLRQLGGLIRSRLPVRHHLQLNP